MPCPYERQRTGFYPGSLLIPIGLCLLGPNVNGFEEDLKHFVGNNKEVVALSAGTAAVHLALLACGVGPGDEVIVQSFTFCASSHPVTYLGATPVFVDSEADTWNMDPVLLEEAIKDRIAKTGKKPKAIVPGLSVRDASED